MSSGIPQWTDTKNSTYSVVSQKLMASKQTCPKMASTYYDWNGLWCCTLSSSGEQKLDVRFMVEIYTYFWRDSILVSVVWFMLGANLAQREREKNVLFNDTLNTFYLRLYGVRHMVKDHSDSEKGNPLPPHRLLLSINSKGSFICTIPQTG